jgi:competence ComEA-like helix-hairpin-helix protein
VSLSRDESRALGFIALLLVVSAAVRLADRPEPIQLDASVVDIPSLEAAGREVRAREDRARTPLAAGERIDPNTAPLEELMRLPRVGRATAERIIADRERNGPFRSVEDLTRVRGIGPASVAEWAERIALPARGAPGRGGPGLPGGAAAPAPIDLNRATAEELERLPGVGPVVARRIVAWRDSAGGFTNMEELRRIRGIGPALLEAIRPLVRP